MDNEVIRFHHARRSGAFYRHFVVCAGKGG